MEIDRKHREKQWRQYTSIAFSMLLGAVCGFLIVTYLYSAPTGDGTLGEFVFSFLLLLVSMYAAFLLQIIIHETGHLVFGLLTGYRYSSFRIGGFMWVKERGRLKFKKLKISGMGGQCLMSPPEIVDGKIPFVLYNLGGPLINMASSLIFLGLYLLCRNVPYLSIFLLMVSVIGFAYALINGFPMRLGMVNNDGYNTLSIGKNDKALHAFWIQFKVNEQITKGIRLKDMPEEWFTVTLTEEMKNSMTAAMSVFACNRLMDIHLFEESDQLMDKLLGMDSAIVGLHRKLMTCDRIYCELVGENRQDLLDRMLDKQQKKFMKSMKSYPSVLRTEYSYALLAEKDAEKAAKIKMQFEKCARTYPYFSNIESEHELICIADFVAKK